MMSRLLLSLLLFVVVVWCFFIVDETNCDREVLGDR